MQYGQYTVYSSWSSLLTIFITLNLAYGTFSTAMVKFKKKRNEYTSSIGGIFMLCGIIFLLIYFPLHEQWNILFELPTFLVVIMIVEIISMGATDCWLEKRRFEYKYKSVIGMTLAKTVISPVLAFGLVLISEEKGYARIIGYAFVNIVFGLIIMIYNFYKGKTFFDKVFWKYAFSFNLPLLPYYISQMIFNTSDRIMISHYCGQDKAAIYGVAYSLSILLTFVINAINSSYAPWFFERLETGNGNANKRVSLNLSIIVALGLWGIIAIAPEFIAIMAGNDYIEGVWAVPPVAASMLLLFYTQLFDRVLFFYEKKYLLILGGIVPSIVNLLLNFIFIPIYGFVAAAYTTLISYIIFVIINYFTMKKTLYNKGNKDDLYDIKKLIILFIIFCMGTMLMMLLYNSRLFRYAIIFAICLIIIVKNKKIIGALKEIK